MLENTNTKDTITEVTEPRVIIHRDLAPHRRVSYRICKECGKMYHLTDGDAIYFITKYGSLPLRCETCREKNRTDIISKV